MSTLEIEGLRAAVGGNEILNGHRPHGRRPARCTP